MKKLIIIPLILISCIIYGQGKLSKKPTDTVLDSTDLFWSVDKGITDKKMAASVITDYINTSVDSARSALADSAAQLRSEISGSEGWSKSGNYIYLTTATDSTGIGTSTPTEKFEVNGNVAFDSATAMEITTNALTVGSNATGGYLEIVDNWVRMNDNAIMWENGSYFLEWDTELFFYSPFSGLKSLGSLDDESVLAGNAMTLTSLPAGGKRLDWHGGLSQNTTITGGNYSLSFNGMDNLTFDLDSFYLFRFDYDSVYLGNHYILGGPLISDFKTTPLGLRYAFDYSSTIEDNDRSIPDMGTIKNHDWDSINLFGDWRIVPGTNLLSFKYSDNNTFGIGSEETYAGFSYINGSVINLYDDYVNIHWGDVENWTINKTMIKNADDTLATIDTVKTLIADLASGEVNISGTLSAGQIPIAVDASTIRGTDSLKYINGTLTADSVKLVNNSKIYFGDKSNNYFIRHGSSEFLIGDANGNFWGSDYLHFGASSLKTDNPVFYCNGNSYTRTGRAESDIALNRSRYQTGIVSVAQDAFGFQTNASLNFYVAVDSVVSIDSLYFDYIGGGSIPEPCFAVITETGAIDSSSVDPAGEPITYAAYLPDFKTFYNDTKKIGKCDERNWITGFDTKKMQFTWTRRLPSNENAFEILQRAIEHRDVYLNELYEQNESQHQKIDALEKENAELKSRIEAIENKLGL